MLSITVVNLPLKGSSVLRLGANIETMWITLATICSANSFTKNEDLTPNKR